MTSQFALFSLLPRRNISLRLGFAAMRFRNVPLALAFLAACAPKHEPTVALEAATYTASEFAFAGPDSLAPGLTTVRFVNGGKMQHHLMLARLDSGKTMADLQAFMQANP